MDSIVDKLVVMKGKLFKTKPVPAKNEVFEYFLKKPKPWEAGKEKEYNWRTSIFDKWVDIKGESFFHHVSQANRPKLSIDLLQNTQQYESQLRRQGGCLEIGAGKEDLPRNAQNNSRFIRTTAKKMRKRQFSLDLQRCDARLVRADQSFTKNLMGSSRPGTKEARCNSARAPDRTQMQEFMMRFEKKAVIPNREPVSKGLFGWKLKTVNASKKRRNSFCGEKKESELTFKAICSPKAYQL